MRRCTGCGNGELFHVLLAAVKRSTDRTIKVGVGTSQRTYFILGALNSPEGVSASVAEMVYLAEDLVSTV